MIFEFSIPKSIPKYRVSFPFAWWPIKTYWINKDGAFVKHIVWLERYRVREVSKSVCNHYQWYCDGYDPLIGKALEDFNKHGGEQYYSENIY